MAKENPKYAWGPRGENVLIGKDIPRLDGVAKASGQAKYTADINTPGTLYARLLTCKHAAAVLKKLDVESVKKMPGVKAVHVFKEINDKINWDGELIAAVAAERDELARDAIKALEAAVVYEVLPHFVDESDLKGAQAAKRADQLGKKSEGNADEAIKKAKLVHKGHYGIVTISHMCLEPHGSHCAWNDENLDVHLSTQNVSGTAGQFAEPLEIDASKVTVTSDYEGGGFGSKFQADEWGIACAKMAKEAGRPVRLMLDRATELKVAGTRPSAFADITIAADEDGKVVAWDSVHWGTAGIGGGGVDVTKLPYVFDFPNRRASQIGLKCNVGPNRAWRAPPHPQLCALTQTALDDVAAKLKLNSYEVFEKNLASVGNGKASVYAEEMKIAAKAIGWHDKWHLHGKAPQKGAVKRGLGMALHTWGGGAGPCTCKVKLHPDGSVETSLGSQDIGTGTRTVIAITLAETLGIPLAQVKVNLGSSKYPASAASGGSITIGGVTGAHRRAGQRLLWKLYEKVAEKYGIESTDGLKAKDGQILNGGKAVCTWKQACALVAPMGLEVHVERSKPDGYDEGDPTIVGVKKPERDGLSADGVGGVQMVEVDVDTDTGIVRIVKFVCVQDCGLIIDELTARSQVLGALIMGIAYSLSEERVMDNRTGRYLNADLANYKLPRIGDIGELQAIMYQPDSEYNRGVVGLGEPPVIAPGAAISNAVCNAIGVRVPVLPLTPRRVLEALRGGDLS